MTAAMLMDELQKAVDACQPEDFDEKGLIIKAFRTFSSENDVALLSWKFDPLIRDYATALRLYKVALVGGEVYRMKKSECGGNSECLISLMNAAYYLEMSCKRLQNHIESIYAVRHYILNDDPEEYVKSLGTNAQTKELAKIKIELLKRIELNSMEVIQRKLEVIINSL